jgi:uncharacterized damage-inducible protein DinB
MPDISPDQATFLLQTVTLPTMKREQATTMQIIQAIPLDKGDYRPEPVAKTAFELAWHIVTAEHRFMSGVANVGFNYDPIPRPDSVRNSADIAQWYVKSFEADFQRLSHLTGDQLIQVLDFRGVFQLPAVFYLQFTINHSIHHRGQLSTYLRPMGGKVPNIYGESYDGAEARKAAQAKSA